MKPTQHFPVQSRMSGHAADHHHDPGEKTSVSQKELVIETIRKLPEEVTIDEIVEEIALLAAIQRASRMRTPVVSCVTSMSGRRWRHGFKRLDSVPRLV